VKEEKRRKIDSGVKMKALCRVSLLLFSLMIPLSMLGQGLGSIVGTVTDPSGAVVPGAQVKATENGTGVTRTAVTDSQGYYVISALRPAEYTVTLEAKGFRTAHLNQITLLANQTLTVNSKIEVGQATEVIDVTENATQVDTTTATLKQVIEGQRVLELPLNGRNAAALTLLVPGTTNDPNNGGADQGTTKTFPGAVTYSINGSRQNQTSYQLDGGNFVDEYSNTNQPFPFPDALQEFSVQTSNYGAEYGQNAGGVVNVVTKSGSDQFHGDVFEFLRNAVFNARSWDANFAAKDHGRDQLKRNQFGGVIGGPIIKGKTFFFAGYQGTRVRNVGNPSTASVFTAAQRASATDPAIKNLLKFIPLGDPGVFDSTGQPRVTYAKPQRDNYNEVLGRVDHSITNNDRLTFRFDYNRFHRDPVFEPTNILTYTDGTNFIVNQNYLLHETHVFSTNLLNDFRFSYARETSDRGPAADVPSVADLGVNIFQPNFGKGIQTISVSGLSGFPSIGDNPHATFERSNFTWSDDVSWVLGRHNLKLGGTLELSRVDIANPGFFGYGTFGFSSVTNFLKGQLNTFQQGAGEFKNNRNTFTGLYIQDNFHASRKLTLTAGVRWEPFQAWDEIKNRVEVFRIQDAVPGGPHSSLFTGAPPGLYFKGDKGVPPRGVESNWLNFAPRLGFAYDVFGDGKTSVRGGYGMFYDTRITGLANNRVVDLTPFSPQVGQITFGVDSKTGLGNLGPFSDPYCQKSSGCAPLNNPFPITLPVSSNFVFPTPVQMVGYDASKKLQTPLMYGWNLGLEHEFTGSILARVAYVGSHGSHIKESVQMNPALPSATVKFSDAVRRLNTPFASTFPKGLYGAIWEAFYDINSNYNSLQASLEKRAKALTVQVSYTWQKSIDDLPVGGNVSEIGSDTASTRPWDDPLRHLADYGPSEFDRTHRLAGSYVWNLPQMASWNTAVRHVLGGWALSGSMAVQTGRALTVTSGLSAGSDRSGTGLGNDRANYVGGNVYGGNKCGTSPHCVDWINNSSTSPAFVQPAAGTFGNVSKGFLRGPRNVNWDMGLLKNFSLTERWKMQFRAEFFNVFNHTNLNDPASSNGGAALNSSGFGQITGSGDPRIGQLALKLIF
jgi:hypothetical protein